MINTKELALHIDLPVWNVQYAWDTNCLVPTEGSTKRSWQHDLSANFDLSNGVKLLLSLARSHIGFRVCLLKRDSSGDMNQLSEIEMT